MLYVDNRDNTDARLNLALDEYLVREAWSGEDLLLFYINAPSVIIGRHQNTAEEIDSDYIRNNDVRVVRRVSGGGAVYHDLGNLNFSFITAFDPHRFNRYEEFTRPVVEVLRDLGVPAELGGRNDILAGGRKISGNAQFVTRDRMMSHGTVLVDSNLDDVVASLRVKPGKIESKGIKSIRSRVANISEFLERPLETKALKELILQRVFAEYGAVPTLQLGPDDWARIEELAETKYGSWDWNYGESPRFDFQRAKRFASGEVDVRVAVDRGGRIETVRIYGDFMGQGEVADLERALVGVRYDRAEIGAVVDTIRVEQLLGGVSAPELIDLLYA